MLGQYNFGHFENTELEYLRTVFKREKNLTAYETEARIWAGNKCFLGLMKPCCDVAIPLIDLKKQLYVLLIFLRIDTFGQYKKTDDKLVRFCKENYKKST